MKIIKQLIKELIILALLIFTIVGTIGFIYSMLKNKGYNDEQIIGAAMYASILSIIFTGVVTLIYNLFIGFPVGIMIEKQKKYKEVRAFWIVPSGNSLSELEYGDEWKEKSHWLTYEWEVNGKKYRKSIHTSAWPGQIATFYYLKNPKYAMPIPREIAKFKFERELLALSFIIIYFIAIRLI